MLDRMGWGALALAAVAFQLGAVAEAQIAVLTGPVEAPSCMPRDGACDEMTVVCPTGEVCQSFGGDRKVCAPSPAVFCCDTDADCPTDSSGSAGARACTGIAGLGRGICLPDNDYCAAPDGVVSARMVLACHTLAGSAARVTYESGDCDRDGVRNADDPVPCLPNRLGVWVPGAGGPSCVISETTELVCNEVGDVCTLADDRAAVCTANERTGGQRICSTPPDLFCCGGFVHTACPAGECVLPSDLGDGDGMCTNPRLLCDDAPTMEELLQCHSFRGVLTTIEDGDCDGDGIRNADETQEERCVPNEPADGGVAPSDGGSNLPDAGRTVGDSGMADEDGGGVSPFDAGGTPIEPRFNGGGGCACRSAPARSGAGGWLALVAVGAAIALRRR